MKDNKTVNLNIRVTEEIKKQLQQLADKERRKLSDFIRMKLEDLAAKND